jgi:hypothetical protein
MKCAAALIALLPSLSWAQTYTFSAGSGGEGAVDTGLVDAASHNGPERLPAIIRPGGRVDLNCNSDNLCVADFQNHDTRRASAFESDASADSQRWPGGLARLRVRGGQEGTTDYGSAVCVGFGRKPGEWTFLSCSHNFESGGEPELQLAGEWVPATLLYRDKLAEAVETAPGQYTRVEAGPDRSVLVVNWPGRLRFRPVSLERYVGDVALNGYPSSPRPVTIAGQTERHPSAMKAALERPSQGGFSGGGVFNSRQELVGIWTSGSHGTGYGHYVAEFIPIFRKLGWAPGNWRLTDSNVAQQQ